MTGISLQWQALVLDNDDLHDPAANLRSMLGPGEWDAPNRDTAVTLKPFDFSGLLGCTAIEARRKVEIAGGRLRTYTRGEMLHEDYRPSRLAARIEDNLVVEITGFG